MSDHFGTLCIKGLKAINIGNSLISGGLDNDRILYFIFCQKIYTPNLSTTLGLEIFRHILSKILTNSKKISPPLHPLHGTPLHWLYFTQCLTSFFFVDHLPCIYAWFLILFHLTQVRFSQSTHLLMCCCFFLIVIYSMQG